LARPRTQKRIAVFPAKPAFLAFPIFRWMQTDPPPAAFFRLNIFRALGKKLGLDKTTPFVCVAFFRPF
jgi:hypothetical protein